MSDVREPRRARRRRLARALVSPDSYGSILVLLLITYVASATATQQWQRSLIVVLSGAHRVAGSAGLGRATGRAHDRGARARLRGGRGASWRSSRTSRIRTSGLLFIASSALYFIAPLSILRSIVLQREVDQEAVLGAIDAYLFVGMFFAFAYQAIGAFDDPFFRVGSKRRFPARCSSASRRSRRPDTATSCRRASSDRRSRSARCSWASCSW